VSSKLYTTPWSASHISGINAKIKKDSPLKPERGKKGHLMLVEDGRPLKRSAVGDLTRDSDNI
jgi:hypothetical protein